MKDHPPSPSVNLRPSLRTLEPSPVLAASETTDILRAQGTPVAKLALSQSPFPVPESLVQALRQAAPIKSYAPVQGLLPLREKIAAYLKRRFQVERSPEDVLIGPGSKELCFLLSLAHEGPLIVPTPCWSSIIPQARILHKPLFLIHTTREDQFMLRPDTLSNTLCSTDLRGAILYLNSPSNPCG
ncbi:MAG: aminotransferase class I/II-fold pyridoxal phosphate-dependent enzyme, partial [Deltaproteobacteria bacterium]|nr:aminotransferase class I/II-fold pyridoxal phosphate-dependent enzyme [Deltaproteobacteria bacterium]